MEETTTPQTVAFKNPETAAQYECTQVVDLRIHVPGHNYRDLISNIPPRIADILIQQGIPWIKKKTVAE